MEGICYFTFKSLTLKITPNLSPLRALDTGTPVKKISAAKLNEQYDSAQNNYAQIRYSNIRQKIVDTYYPSTDIKETPLTFYKYDSATKTIKKIKIIDNKL